MFATILAALGLGRSTTHVRPANENVRRARWRGSDGRWEWRVAQQA